MEAAGSTRVTRQFQVTIPKKARDALKIKEGDVLFVYINTNKKEVVLRKTWNYQLTQMTSNSKTIFESINNLSIFPFLCA